MKVCCTCKLLKHEFDKNKNNVDGLGNRCKDCRRENDKKRWHQNKEAESQRARNWRNNNIEYLVQYEKGKKYRSRYWKHLTMDEAYSEFLKLLTEQKECCAICNSHQSNFKMGLVVDHCHATGKVRALLCQNCNAMIGLAKENINTLENGIKYLKDNTMNGQTEGDNSCVSEMMT